MEVTDVLIQEIDKYKAERDAALAMVRELVGALKAMIDGSEWSEERGRFVVMAIPSPDSYIQAHKALTKAEALHV